MGTLTHKWFRRDHARRRSRSRRNGNRYSVAAVTCSETLEQRLLLTEGSLGNWIFRVDGSGTPNTPEVDVTVPADSVDEGASTSLMGSQLAIHYRHSDGNSPQYWTFLTDGFYRMAVDHFLTSYRSFSFFAPDGADADTNSDPRDNSTATSFHVRGVNDRNQLELQLNYRNEHADSETAFNISMRVLLNPPISDDPTHNSMSVDITVTNAAKADFASPWQGHVDFGEHASLFGISSMFVARDLSEGIPAWFTNIENLRGETYHGDLSDSDPLNDGRSPKLDAVDGDSNGHVSTHDVGTIITASQSVELDHDMAQTGVLPDYPWKNDLVVQWDHSREITFDHEFDNRRNHAVRLLNASGIVTDTSAFGWNLAYTRDGTVGHNPAFDELVDGDNIQAKLSARELASWPANNSQTIGLQLVTGDPTPGFTVAEFDNGLTVSESGTTDTFTAVLNAAPASPVVINVSTPDTDEVAVVTSTLTFDADNWHVPQIVTITGVDDAVIDGDQPTSIILSVDDANSDDAFDSSPDQSIMATTTDDDDQPMVSLSVRDAEIPEEGLFESAKLLVPAYANPCCNDGPEYWQELIEAASHTDMTVILNPASGPGASQIDPNYVNSNGGPVLDLKAAGGTFVGYVSTEFGKRKMSDVEEDIDRYYDPGYWRGAGIQVDGIFFDEMSNDLSKVGYYRDLHNYLHDKHSETAIVIGNPGVSGTVDTSGGTTPFTVSDYVETADTLVTFENKGEVYRTDYTAPAWVEESSAEQFAHLIHTEPEITDVFTDIVLAKERKAGFLFITSDAFESNPWDNVSTWWTSDTDFTATLSDYFSEDVTVELSYSGTAGAEDYSAATTITIPAGQLSASTKVDAAPDDQNENPETVTAEIIHADNAIVAGVQPQTTTIVDNDPFDLFPADFNVVNDVITTGVAEVRYVIRNTAEQPVGDFTTHVVWSPNDIVGDADDIIIPDSVEVVTGTPGVETIRNVSLNLDVELLYDHALASNPAGQPIGTVSAESSRLFLVIDVHNDIREADEDNNFGRGDSIDSDDITYFPWDRNQDTVVTPRDALGTIHAIGSADASSDFDGNGTVTPLEALDVIQRIGYVRNDSVIVDALAVGLTKTFANVPTASPLASPLTFQLPPDDENSIFHPFSTDDERTTVVLEVDDEDGFLDEHFKSGTEWLSVV